MNTLRLGVAAVLAGVLVCDVVARGEDIEGAQTMSADQPYIYMNVRRGADGKVMEVKEGGQATFAIKCFLDTGASGIVLSHGTFEALGIRAAKTQQGTDVLFEDVGVGGAEHFQVSEPLHVALAPFSSVADGDNPGSYGGVFGPIRMQLRPEQGLMDMLTGGLDVAGMPVLAGKVMVVDVRKLNKETDMLRTSVVAPKSPEIPKVDYTVQLTPVSFGRFTRTVPSTAEGPTIRGNPMIGPDPFGKGSAAPPVTVAFKGKSTGITMLLDTGASFSMISKKAAERIGVVYSEDGSKLVGIPDKDQFGVMVGGIGGQKAARGFYLDTLSLPTKEGKPVRYLRAPVLVNDISVADSKTGEKFTLEGVFGMNFLVASASVNGGGLLPDIGEIHQGAYDFLVVDLAAGTLGLKMAGR